MSKIGRKALCQLKNSIFHDNADKPVTRRKTSALWGLLAAGGVGMGMGLAPTSAKAACATTTAGKVWSCTGAITNQTFDVTAQPFSITLDKSAALAAAGTGDGVLISATDGTGGFNGTFNLTGTSLAQGSILMNATGGDGVFLKKGDTVTLNVNGTIDAGPTAGADGMHLEGDILTVNVGALGNIVGDDDGIEFATIGQVDAASTTASVQILNAGSITGQNGSGIDLVYPTTNTATFSVIITNSGSGSITGGTYGINVENTGSLVTISNLNTADISGQSQDAINVDGATTVLVTNSSPSSIVGAQDGVAISNATSATVDNDGGSITGTADDGIDFNAIAGPANVSNIAGVILGSDNGIEMLSVGVTTATGASVLNKSGDITGTLGDGIQVTHNDGNLNITNLSGGTIMGAVSGIDINTVHMGNVTIDNTGGTIDGGATGFGINVADVTGSDVTIDNMTGLVSGGTAVFVSDIDGLFLLSNTSGTVTGTAGDGVHLFDIGTTATIKNSGGLIAGTSAGIFASQVGGANTTLTNVSITNAGTGSIAGGIFGIHFLNQNGTLKIDNSGTISGALSVGIFVSSGTGALTVSNTSGSISGRSKGIRTVSFSGSLTVNNIGGSITATAAGGVGISATGGTGSISIVNDSSGSITGLGRGVSLISQVGSISISNNTGLISGGATGVIVGLGTGAVTIDNDGGTITGGRGVNLSSQSGSLSISNVSGLISGAANTAIRLFSGTGNVTVGNSSGNMSGS
ncbi:MAG: S-layer family protein, partial [Proteobacteria bacterium]|nr:S-layer family protein [Pseudomonadota bacterium]